MAAPQADHATPAFFAALDRAAPFPFFCRLTRAALVCRRWHKISGWPELQQTVVVCLKRASAAHSLLLWLRRHRRSLRSLAIEMEYPNINFSANYSRANYKAELLSHLARLLAFCSRGLQTTTIVLPGHATQHTHMADWALAAPRLLEFNIAEPNTGMLHVNLRGMRSLQRLKIDARKWCMSCADKLPASLTRLCIRRHTATELPSQVGGVALQAQSNGCSI